MIFWILIAVLTAGVAGLLIAPLMKPSAPPATSREDEAAVYRDQLKEIDRDLSLGLIGEKEADYARAEIGRRLLAATDAPQRGLTPASMPRRHRITTLLVILCPPVIGLAGYLMLGSPGMPDQPLAARLANPGNNIELLIAKAERHLAQTPNDGAGWDLLAPIYMRTGRYADADQAFRNAIRILGETPQRLGGLGETLVAANQGIVTDEARGFFEKASKLDPDNMRSQFYVALGLEQAGRKKEALEAFSAIKRASPPGAAWEALVNQHIAANSENAPGNPTAADVAAAQDMSGKDRQAMIGGMVASLADRLKQDPNNIEGWLRLVRSYMVLGREQEARDALKNGLKTFPAETGDGQRLVSLAREVGLGEGIVQ